VRDISFFTKIYIAVKPVDFRKQAHGLALVVEHAMELNNMADKALFVFTNRRRSAVKLLYWDQSGYAMWWKTLEHEKFKWPKCSASATTMLAPRELKWLLEGIDISSLKKHKIIKIS